MIKYFLLVARSLLMFGMAGLNILTYIQSSSWWIGATLLL